MSLSRFALPGFGAYARHVRIASAIMIVLMLAIFIAGSGLYILMRSEAIENSALNERIEAGIQNLIGPQYKLELGRTTIGFDRDGLMSFSSSGVRVVRSSDGQLASQLGRVIIGIKPLSLLIGDLHVNAVIIEDSTLDLALLDLPPSENLPTDVDGVLQAMKSHLVNAEKQFRNAEFRLIKFRDIRISGIPLGRPSDREIFVDRFDLRRKNSKRILLDAELHTDQSQILAKGSYLARRGEPAALDLSLNGLSMREWTGLPNSEEGQLGSDALVSVEAKFPYEEDVFQPTIDVKFSQSDLRVGKRAITDIKQLDLKFRLLPSNNQIELDPSVFVAGDFNAMVVGGLRPAEGATGYDEDLIFELILDPASRLPTIQGEETVNGSFKMKGIYQRADGVIDINDILVLAGEDKLEGALKFGLAKPTPSLKANFRSAGIDGAAIKQLWPFFIGSPARAWIHKHVVGGRVTDIELVADVPEGVIGRFREGTKMKADEFVLTANFQGAQTDTFGELPPVKNGEGTISLEGMKLDVNFESGHAEVPNGDPVELVRGNFIIKDIGERPNPAEVAATLAGDSKSVSILSDFHPLNVFRDMSLDPLQVTGNADVDVVATFPIKKGLKKEEVDWHAIVNLEDSGSNEPVFGRDISNADLMLDATAQSVRILGNAIVDGTKTKLDMTEPIGGSDVVSSRNFSAVLDNAARKKMGLSLGSLVDGPISVSVEQLPGGIQRQRVDLGEAVLSLPWIGWQKGKSIPAIATFDLRQQDNITWLDNFYVEGDGFLAAGEMAFDKIGILSADFADISLNEGDSFSLKLNRKKNVYNITFSGTRMDARGLINKLFHIGGFGEDQGTSNVRLSGNLGTVRGFNGRVLNNVKMSYGTSDGWFDNLSLRGTFTDSTYVNVFATTTDGKTTFNVDSTDAGSALAFVDVYRRMTGGDLRASLSRERGGAFIGPVRATNFLVTDEPRLQSIVGDPVKLAEQRERGYQALQDKLSTVETKRVRFLEAKAQIEKSDGFLSLEEGVLTGAQFGFTFDGILFDPENRMDLKGTFLPALAISRAIGLIPIVGNILGNGRDTGLIGITFRMSGPSRNPKLEINPISVVAPGVFRKVFEFRDQ
ncbi:MAG: DUF3971 domain-containing protein [Pseudomonadota bacterium]